MQTGRNIHSHSTFDSPVSGRQEVSAFGDRGDGDSQDNWVIECESGDVDGNVYGSTQFYLRHAHTGMYLYTDSGSKYTQQNCRRCPIVGHSEVSAAKGKTKGGLWTIHSGFFYPPSEGDEEAGEQRRGDGKEESNWRDEL